MIKSGRWKKYDQESIDEVQHSKQTKTYFTVYTTSSDVQVGLDLNEEEKWTTSGASDFSMDADEM